LQENSLGTLYDSVLIPALSLAEQDRHGNALDENRTTFIYQNARELIEELNEGMSKEDDSAIHNAPDAGDLRTNQSQLRILCIPARDEADEIVGIMITQILQRAGHDAHVLPIGTMADMLAQVETWHPELICVSALPPFAAGQAKSLCKQIRKRYPRVKLVLGLWDFPGGVAKAQERIGVSCADAIGTSLAQMVALIEAHNSHAAAALTDAS
jgi:hypothetical protein